MFKILIADDESLIRLGVKTILSRELDFDIEFEEAENGIIALDICKKFAPDLVITDIRMPCCDGLNFVKLLRKNKKSPEVIILTGYENFEYAKKAISLGVKEYILKPINKLEFVTIINKHAKDIILSNKTKSVELAITIANENITTGLKQSLIMQLFYAQSDEISTSIVEKLKELGVNNQNNFSVAAVVHYYIDNNNKDFIDFAVKNILDEVLANEFAETFISIQKTQGQIIIIFEGNEQVLLLTSAKKALIKACLLFKKYLGVDFYIGVGNIVYDFIKIRKSYTQASDAAMFKIYNQNEYLTEFAKIQQGTEINIVDISAYLKPIQNINSDKVLDLISNLAKIPPSYNTVKATEFYYNTWIKLIEEEICKHDNFYTQKHNKYSAFEQLWSFSKLRQQIILATRFIQEFSTSINCNTYNKKLLNEVIAYVKIHATEDINLNIVAQLFNRTPSHISTIFKKGTGVGFNTFITNERIKKAKTLLINSNIPVSQISDLCGYPNSKYFSVVFKKITKSTPANYRQSGE